jgi:hypothetical protein
LQGAEHVVLRYKEFALEVAPAVILAAIALIKLAIR